MSFKKQIFYPMLIASLILLVAITWLFVIVLKIVDQQDDLHSIIDIRDNIQGLQTALIDIQTNQRVFLLTDNKLSVEAFYESKTRADHFQASLATRAATLPDIKHRVALMHPQLGEAVEMVEKTIQLRIKGDSGDASTLLSAGSKAMYTQRDELVKLDKALRDKNLTIAQNLKHNLYRALAGAVVVLFGITFILYFSYRRTLQLFDNALQTRQLADELNHLATHDALTKLPNRRNFDQSLRRALSLTKRNGTIFGLLYMDLDGFKTINDKYGHDVGDAVLCEVSKRLEACLRESEMLARIGGDEFALIVQHFGDVSVLKHVANRIIVAIAPTMEINGKKLHVGISIGIAHYPMHGITAEEIIAKADDAMFASKRGGKNMATMAS